MCTGIRRRGKSGRRELSGVGSDGLPGGVGRDDAMPTTDMVEGDGGVDLTDFAGFHEMLDGVYQALAHAEHDYVADAQVLGAPIGQRAHTLDDRHVLVRLAPRD